MTNITNPSLDDTTMKYVMAAQPPFDAMRALAAQMAGLLLLRVVDPKAEIGPASSLDLLSDRLAEAEEQLSDVTPRGIVAIHHYKHLTGAMQSLRQAHQAAPGHLTTRRLLSLSDACERPLNEAISQLRHAANALPGFELVDLADCCGAGMVSPAVED